MTSQLISYRQNHRKIADLPTARRVQCQIYQSTCQKQYNNIHVLEILDDFIHADKETCSFELLSCRAPLHVDTEEVAEDGFGEVD